MDITEKHLEEYNDVFADIVNVLIFNGKEAVMEEELVDVPVRSMYKAQEGTIHEQERDICKYWKKDNVRISLYGLENQTEYEKYMPFRVIGYDGQAYRSELLEFEERKKKKHHIADHMGERNSEAENNIAVQKRRSKEMYPIITMVLYFGMTHWKKSRHLRDCFNIPKDLKPYVSDYKINVFEIAYLTDEQVNMFKSDFRIVADYFVQMRRNKEYVPSRETIKHVDALLKMMAVLTADNRFVEINENRKESVKNMCECLDNAINTGMKRGMRKGIRKGIRKGMRKGIMVGQRNALISLAKKGILTVEEAAEEIGMTVEEFEKLMN